MYSNVVHTVYPNVVSLRGIPICRYIDDLFKEFVGGEMLYFVSVCTEEERLNAIEIMKIMCGDYSAIGNSTPDPIQLSKEVEHAPGTTIMTVGNCLAMKEDPDDQTCITGQEQGATI